MKYQVFICDDEIDSITLIKDIVLKAGIILSDEEKIEFSIQTANTYQAAVKYLRNTKISGGIYFLDVELGKEVDHDSGFDIAELIKKRDQKAQIIFVTSHADLSIFTYQRRLGPVDYIVKTDEMDKFKRRLVQTIEVALKHIAQFNYMKKLTFSYRIGRIVRNMNIDDIMYITTTPVPHKLLLIKNIGEAQFLGSLHKYAEENPLLTMISQSCLVNPKNIRSIDFKKRLVEFANGDVREYARSYSKTMRKLLNDFNYKEEKLIRHENEY